MGRETYAAKNSQTTILMTGFEAYKLFQSLNNHFFSEYDYIKYSGGLSIKPETYEKKSQSEKYRYERLGRKFGSKEDLENFIVSNLVVTKKRLWIGALAGNEPEENHRQWQQRIESLQYTFASEMKAVIDKMGSFNAIFKAEEGQHPELLKSLIRSEISMETFLLLDMCVSFISRFSEKLKEDRNWLNIRFKALKYKPFLERLEINTEKLKDTLATIFDDLGIKS